MAIDGHTSEANPGDVLPGRTKARALRMDEPSMALLRETAGGGRVPDSARFLRELTARNTRGPQMAQIHPVRLDGLDGRLGATVYRPLESSWGTVVFADRAVEEGGSPWATETLARRIAERTSCEVVAIRPTPGLDDTTATAALVDLIRRVGGEDAPRPLTDALVVVGHGAGARWALEVMGSEPGLARQHVGAWELIGPSLVESSDVAVSTAPAVEVADFADRFPTLEPGGLATRIAAVEAPQARVSVHCGGDSDITSGAAEQVVDQLARRGVDATLRVYPGQVTGFFSIASLPIGERTLQAVIGSVRACVRAARSLEVAR